MPNFWEQDKPAGEADVIRTGLSGPMGATDAELDREIAGTRQSIAQVSSPDDRAMLEEHLSDVQRNRARPGPTGEPETPNWWLKDQPAEQRDLPEGTRPSNAGAGRGVVNPPAVSPEAPTSGSTGEDLVRNFRSGLLGTVAGAGAAISQAVGADRAAESLDSVRADLEQDAHDSGGQTVTGKAANIVGSVTPALLLPASKVSQLVGNAGLFAIPAFRDTLKAQLEAGRSFPLALAHAAESFGINLFMPTVATRGSQALTKALGAGEAQGLKAAGVQGAQAAGEGAAFSVGSSVLDKATDRAAEALGDDTAKNERDWVDLKDVAANALGFTALRGAHLAPQAAEAINDRIGSPSRQFGRAFGQDVDAAQFGPAEDAAASEAGFAPNPNLRTAPAERPPGAAPDTSVQGAEEDVQQQMRDLGIPPGLTMEQQLAQLQQRNRAKQMRDAGEDVVADELDRRANMQSAEHELPAVSDGSPEFEDAYRTLREAGAMPAEASARAGMIGAFTQHAQQAGITPNAIEAAMQKASKLPLAKVPTFLDTYASALSSAGMGTPLAPKSIEQAARTAGEQAMGRAVETLYPTEHQVAPGAELPNGFRQGPKPGEKYRVGTSDATGGALALEKRLPGGTAATFYVGKDGGLVDADSVDLSRPETRERLWVPGDEKKSSQAQDILNRMGALDLSDPQRAALKQQLKALVTESPTIRPSTGATGVDVGAHDAATSPFNARTQPTEPQKQAGNYAKGHVKVGGLDIKAWARSNHTKEPLGDLSHIELRAEEEGQAPKAKTATPDEGTARSGQAAEADTAGGGAGADAGGQAPAVGRGHVPLEEGGKPFASRAEASKARRLVPHLRVARVDGGFALVPKSAAQLAAEERAARRLTLPKTSPKGVPIPAHAFIAAEGGLRQETKAEIGVDTNVRVGNRMLFAAKGKGLTLAQASELLHQHHYIAEEDERNAIDVIQRSLTTPQYNPEGWAQLAQAHEHTRYEDHLQAVQEHEHDLVPVPEEYLKDTGADSLTPEQHDELRALASTLEAEGVDTEAILERAAQLTENGPAHAYYEKARDSLQAAAGGGRAPADSREGAQQGRPTPEPAGDRRGGEVSGQQDARRGEGKKDGLSWDVRPTGTLAIKGDAAKIREVLKDIPARSIMVMDGGLMVGRTQVDKALRALEGTPQEPKAKMPLSVGTAPGDAEPVTVKDGIVHIGKHEAIDFDTGEPVKVKDGASDEDIKKALRDAGTLSKRQKFMGGSEKKQDLLGEAPNEYQQQASKIKGERAEKERTQQEKAPAPDDFKLSGSDRKADENPDQTPLFSRRALTPEERSANFRRWSNDAPVVRSAEADTYGFKTGQKVVVEAFHGTQRPDRIGTVFKRNRATSGPMSFFTSSPDLASSYAKGKSDTSLMNEDQHYATWFKYKPPGARSAVDIERAWWHLSGEERAKIAELAPRVTFSDDQESDGGNKIVLGPEGHDHGTGGYDQHLKEARGNHLGALVDEWLNSANLFNDEERFLQVLKLAGFPVKDVTYDSPHAEYPAVYHAHIFMQKPLVTSDIPQEVRDRLDAAAKRDRSRPAAGGADAWDKNTRTLRQWVDAFNGPDNEYAWTSIPDKVTAVLKSMGYDGIIDWSGKGGGTSHPVYIPFEETQVKSALGNRGTFDRDSKNILFNRSTEPFYSALSREVDGIGAKAMPAEGWANRIKGLVNAGKVKADEVEWSGLGDWLKLQQGKVTKEQISEFLKNNGVQVQTVEKGGTTESNQQRLDSLIVRAHSLGFEVDRTRRGPEKQSGLSREDFHSAMSEAFGDKVADRLEKARVVVPLEDQSKLPEHVVPFVRDGDRVYGFYDPRTDRTYAVLSNLDRSMVKGLALHEVGVHYGFEDMLGKQKYAQVINRIATMGRLGHEAVLEARKQAQENAARPHQVPEETLAYLVQNRPELGLVRDVIARIKAFLFEHFGIGGDSLTVDDIAALARAAVLHSSRTQPGERRPDFAQAQPAMASENALREIARQARKAGNENRSVDIAPVDASLVAEAKRHGLDLEGYRHTADSFAVRHAMNKHSDAAAERARGQLALTEDDIAAVPIAITTPDARVYGVKNTRGQDLIGSIKHMPDGSTMVVEEVRTGRKALALASLRKYPAGKDTDSIARTLLSNARSDGGDGTIVVERQQGPKLDSGEEPGFSRSPGEPKRAPGAYHAYDGLERQPFKSKGGIVDSIAKALQPAARDQAKLTAGIVRSNLAEQARGREMAQKELVEFAQRFDKMPVQDNYKFIDAMERGTKLDDPTLNEAAQALRKVLDERRDQVIALGNGALENFNENYFPHIWKDKAAASRFFTRRPLEGGKGFLKQRTYDFFSEGLAAGLEPVTTNPVELALLKAREMDRYIYGQRIFQEMKDKKVAKFVPFGEKAPDGWDKINDRIARVMQYSDAEKGMILRGEYYAPEPAATIINNHLSPGLQGIAAFDMIRKAGNMMNATQLGLSAFHLGFTTLDAMISKAALGVKQVSRGDVVKGTANVVQSLNPLQPLVNLWKGDRLLKAYMGDITDPDMAPIVDALVQGGGRVKMDDVYRNAGVNEFRQALRKGNYGTAAMKALPRLVDLINKPIFEWLVPRQKLGVFFDMARDALDKKPDMSLDEKRAVMGKLWDSVDNRMGELVYDNVFWNRALKDALMVSVRSVGWNLGTFREIGGGVADLKDVGKLGGLSDRSAYIFGLAFVTAIYGSLTQYLATGEGPKELKDVFFPRTGKTRPDGSEDRLSLPSYMKDIYEYGHDLRNFVKYGDDPFHTIENKLHPLISTAQQIFTNKDFFGGAIRSPGDKPMQQVLDEANYLLKQLTPFSLRNYLQQAKLKGEEPSILGYLSSPSMIGITPSPGYITKTDEQAESSQVSKMHDSLMTKFREELRDGADWSEIRQRAVDAGIRGRDLEFLRKSAVQRPPRRLKSFGNHE